MSNEIQGRADRSLRGRTLLHCCALANLTFSMSFSGCTGPNLMWDHSSVKDFHQPTTQIYIDPGHGVSAPVQVLSDPSLPLSVTRLITNEGSEPVTKPFVVSEQVQRMGFASVAGVWTWAPIPAPAGTVFVDSTVVPPLRVGESAPVDFVIGPPGVLPCGMYVETLSADSTNIVGERNEGDNADVSFFFVDEPGAISVGVVRIPGGQPWVRLEGEVVVIDACDSSFLPLPVVTHSVTITNTTPVAVTVNGGTPVLGQFCGAVGALAPAIPATIAPGAAVTFSYTVTPGQPCKCPGAPCTDWLTESYNEWMGTKLTAISSTGCTIAQRGLSVRVRHACDPRILHVGPIAGPP